VHLVGFIVRKFQSVLQQNTARFLHVSTTLVARITEVSKPPLKRKIQTLKTYGLKHILQHNKTKHL
jgi:hypothetical protein